MRLVKRTHVDADDIRPETVAAVAPADDAQPNAAPERPSHARLDVLDLRRSHDCGRTAEAGLPVLDRPVPVPVPVQQQDLGRKLLQRRHRVLGERRPDGGRVEQEMDLVGGCLAAAAAQGAADVAPLRSDSRVRCGETRNESGEAVEYLAVVCHTDDAGGERRRLLAHEAVQVQTFAVEDHHQSPL